MAPNLGYDPIATVQQAITSLLSTQEPAFIGIGNRMFLSFATILIAWHGIQMMLAWRESGQHMFNFAKLMLIIGLAQLALLFVVSFSMIASAVCGLVGPLFVPFFIVPTLEWLFWNWLKAFIQYSFMLVIANAFIFIFEKFLSRYLQTLPPGMRLEEQLVYGVHAVMILVTFTVGVLLVPSLTASLFSVRSCEAVMPGAIW